MKKANISIIITTYNRKNDVIELLKSIETSKLVNYRINEVILVDNASTDGTSSAISRMFPKVKIVRNKINLGAAGGRNTGLKEASRESDYFLFLDSDFVLDKYAISELVKAIGGKEDYGAATPKILFWDDPEIAQYCGAWVSLLTGINYSKPNSSNFDHMKGNTLAGGALLVRREVAEKVGFYDEEYFIYYEDADYSIRIIKNGYKIIYVPSSKIFHKAPLLDKDRATKRWLSNAFRVARNKIIFMRKHSPYFVLFVLFYPVYFAYYTYKSLQYRRLDSLLNFYKGVISGFAWAIAYSLGSQRKTSR